jgi:predicted RNA-binding Zn ribbon-like protein
VLCLDFVNTLDLRRSLRVEGLRTHADLVAFLHAHDLLDDARAAALDARAEAEPGWAQARLDAALALREALFAVLSAAVRGAAPPPEDLAAVNAALAARAAPPRLVPAGGALGLRWGAEEDDPLAAVLRSAAELVSGDELGRVRECPGSPGKACGWLFVDRTKNGNRVWCVGGLCGNRTRAARHRRDQRERAHGGA